MRVNNIIYKACLLCILLISGSFLPYKEASVTICSWNLKDFGKSKDDADIRFIAQTVNRYDIVLIQEVVAGDGGAQAVARLHDQLNRMGFKWDYSVSDPTSGENSYKRERYAYLWKTSRVKKIGRSWLEQTYTVEIDREPFYSTFSSGSKEFTLVNFHAITKKKQPEREVKYFKFLPGEYPNLNLIFCGDFNLPENHTVFFPLKKMGYESVLKNQRTTLRQACKSDGCLASEFDNFFYKKSLINVKSFGVVHFYNSFSEFSEARKLTDHVPIHFTFSLN